jgi:hypothetical protein
MRRLNLALLFLLLFVGDIAVLGQQGQTSPASATQRSEPSAAPAGYPVDKASPSPATTTAEQPRPENPKLDLTPDANGALSQEQMQQLFRVVADKDIDNDKRQRDYTYVERDVENHLDGKGQVRSTETKTYQVMEIYGEQINRLIQKDDKPLSEKDAAKEEKKVQKVIDKRKNESESDRFFHVRDKVRARLAINYPGLTSADQFCSHQLEVVGIGHFAHKLASIFAVFCFFLLALFFEVSIEVPWAGLGRQE